MSLYTDQITNSLGVPVNGASVYVYAANSTTLATLTDVGGVPVANPVLTDAYGTLSFYAADGPKSLDIWYGGRRRYKQVIAVGTVPSEGISPLDYGMVVNDSSKAASNLAAWNACRAANKNILMPRGTIWMSGPMIIDTPYSTVRFPQRSDGYTDLTGTRVLSTDKTKDAMIIGPDTAPASVAVYPRKITVINPCAGWGVALDPLSGADSALRKAIRINYLLEGLVEYPWAHEGPIGFYYYGLVGTRIVSPKAFRSAAFGGTDKFFGHWAKGSPAILAGGNPSLTIEGALVEMASGMGLSDECGFIADGAFSDVWVDCLETSGCKNPVRITGTGSGGAQGSNIDFRMDKLVLDTITGTGIDIQDISPAGSVQIKNVEVISAAGCAYGVRVRNSAGFVHVEGTIYGAGGAASSGTMRGVSIESSSGVSTDLRLIDCPRPVTLSVASGDFKFAIDNPNVSSSPTQAAVYFGTVTRSTINVRISGKAGAFPQGLNNPANDCANVTLRGMESVNPGCITGGAANKLLINAVSITAPGAYTPAGVSNAAGTMTVVGSMT